MDNGETEQRRTRLEKLREQWMEIAARDFEDMMPKMLEYGPRSLMDVGMVALPDGGTGASSKHLLEAGCGVYLFGKASRMVASVRRGDETSRDTLKDLVTYGMIARMSEELGTTR